MAEVKKNNVLDTPEMHIQDQKHQINTELIGIIKFRQSKKWLISIAVVSLFSIIFPTSLIASPPSKLPAAFPNVAKKLITLLLNHPRALKV